MSYRYNPLELKWGYRRFPSSVKAVWGARAILEERGADIVYSDLASEEETERLQLIAALDGDPKGTGALHVAQLEVKRLLKSGGLYLTPRSDQITRELESRGLASTLTARGSFYRDEANEYVLADFNGAIVAGNTQASHGYIYLVGFIKPADFTYSLMCERCRLNTITFLSKVCGTCHKRICQSCEDESCPNCETIKCKICAKGLECGSCLAPLCRTEECLENYNKCLGCEEAFLCEDCVSDDVEFCSECAELTCAGCNRKLYADRKKLRFEVCERCDSPMHLKCHKTSNGICQNCSDEMEEEENEEIDEEETEDDENDENDSED